MSCREVAFINEQWEHPECSVLRFDSLPASKPVRSHTAFPELVGKSCELQQVLELVEAVAGGDSSALLLGETGTGKELIARAIHDRSPRRDKPFVKLNCAAIPSGLLESELFGHERGAFTGAIAQNIGRLEMANHGSVFLDEIGDIPLELQPKLLRVLQEQEFERLGSTRTKKVNVRIIAATHRDLEGMLARQEFRRDLFYRLHVFPIHIPPLRDRKGDIPLLVHHFIESTTARMKKKIDFVPPETMAALVRHPWPGNIRELENVIERAVILSRGPTLEISPRDLKLRLETGTDEQISGGNQCQTLEEVERNHIVSVLKQTGWVISGPRGAAVRLGLNRTTLSYRMKKMGIFQSINPGVARESGSGTATLAPE